MDIKFPSSKDKDPKRAAIGRWIAQFRQKYRRGELSQHWINRFEQTFPGWWWEWKGDRSEKNKKKLLEMARNREPRPSQKTKIGSALGSYTQKNSNCYDLKFDKQIRKLAPQWFIDIAKENKKKLLEMARNGESRPNCKTTKLGRALKEYIGKTNNSYDPKFDKEIKRLAPHWFVNTVEKNKKKLLKMTRSSETRPHWKTKLGQVLSHYVNKSSNCYDPKFDKKIRRLAPHWFKAARVAA